MVIIWNDLARGDREAAAVLVAINSVIQVLIFAVLGWFYLSVLPGWLGMNQTAIATSTWQIAKSVLIFRHPVGGRIPDPTLRRKGQGRTWYETAVPAEDRAVGALRTAVHHCHPVRPAGRPDHFPALDVARIALPLLAYFAIMWTSGFLVGTALKLGYPRTVTLAFTARR